MTIEKIKEKYADSKVHKLNDGIFIICNDEKISTISNDEFCELVSEGKIKIECETTRGQIYLIL